MSIADVINGCFEGGLAGLVWLNIRQLVRDGEVKGTHMAAAIFVTLWGYWNLYYYPSLHQWFSFATGAALAFGNTVWLALALLYRHTARK